MAKKGRKTDKTMVIVVSIFAIVVLALFFGNMYFSASGNNSGSSGSLKDNELINVDLSACPTDGDTSLTIEVQNVLNTTASEVYDVTAYILAEDGSIVDTITDTTSPSATTVDCGYSYQIAVISTDASGGDSSAVKSILSKPSGSDIAIADGGVVTFTADRGNVYFKLGMEQHGVLEFNAYDEEVKASVYDSSDAIATDYETDGVTFKSTADNATAKAIGAGGSLHYTIKARSTLPDTNFNDQYTLLLLESPVATWATPSLKVDGNSLTSVKGTTQLTAQEQAQFSDYEYIYKINKPILDGNDGIEIELYLEALSGVNPSVDPQLDIASAGRYLQTGGSGVSVGSAKDDSSFTVVYAVQDITFDIS